MSFKQKLIRAFYAGQNKEFFDTHKEEIHSRNSRMIGVLAGIFALVHFGFGILNSFPFFSNLSCVIFYSCSLYFAILFLIYYIFLKNNITATYVFENILLWSFFFSLIYINIRFKDISVFLPLFFIALFTLTISPPITTFLSGLLAYVIAIVVFLNVKDFQVAIFDIINMGVAFFIGIFIGVVVLVERIHSILSKEAISRLGGREKLFTMTGLLEDFESISYADLAGCEYVTYRSTEKMEKVIPNWTGVMDFTERMNLFAETLIVVDDRSHFIQCTEPRNIIHNLENQPSFSVDFRISLDGKIIYYKTKFVKDPDNRYGVIFGIQNIDNETRLELDRVEQKMIARQKQKELEDQARNMEIIQALSEEYTSVYHLNLNTDELIPFRVDRQMRDATSDMTFISKTFTDAFRSFINGHVIPEDKDELFRFCSLDTIRAELLDNENVTKQYRSDLSGHIEFFQIKFVRVGNDNPAKYVIIGIANIDKEIREEKKREIELQTAKNQAETANQAKSQFLSRMSHDIRTPINGVMGMTEIAKKHITEPEKVSDCLNKINIASGHLLGLVNDILDMSRIENGKIQFTSNPLDILELINQCCDIVESQIQEKQLKLYKDFSVIEHKNIMGDELHIKQILINILGNSIKYTPEGGSITFKVLETKVNHNRAGFCFEISDTGIGMSQEFLPHIWDAFSQVKINTGNTTGTGLGMAITKNLVDQMKGSISVSSTEGQGSTFTVNLSFPICKEEIKSMDDVVITDFHNRKILLVEDNRLNTEIAMDLLEEEGIEVYCADNGKKAVEMFQESTPGFYDAILMDIIMPVMDGLEATEAIRALDRSDAATVPIIAMTANAFEADEEKSIAAGMNAHLTKPLYLQLLKTTLSRLLR